MDVKRLENKYGGTRATIRTVSRSPYNHLQNGPWDTLQKLPAKHRAPLCFITLFAVRDKNEKRILTISFPSSWRKSQTIDYMPRHHLCSGHYLPSLTLLFPWTPSCYAGQLLFPQCHRHTPASGSSHWLLLCLPCSMPNVHMVGYFISFRSSLKSHLFTKAFPEYPR